MELRHLTYFAAVAELGTVSKAAEVLHTSQPSLSRQIRDLEQQLGVNLFERIGRRLHLTPAGEDLFRRAREVLNNVQDFRERARSLGSESTGVLRVGATPQTIEWLFPTLLSRFSEQYPGIDVRLTEGHSQSLSESLRKSEIDLALTAYQAEWSTSARMIARAPLLAVTNARLKKAGSRIDLRELQSKPLLLLRKGYGSRDYFDAACAMAHILPNIYLESSAPSTLVALAEAGLGIAIVHATVMPPDETMHCYALTQGSTPLSIRFAVHWNPSHFLPRYAKHFMEQVESVARDLYSFAPKPWRPRLARR